MEDEDGNDALKKAKASKM